MSETVMGRLRRGARYEALLLRADIHDPRPGWTAEAYCRGSSSALWFSTDPVAPDRVCRYCPARLDCLVDALAWDATDMAHMYGHRAMPVKVRRGWLHMQQNTRWLRPIQHGTDGGYAAHLRRGEPFDNCGCREAHNVAVKLRKAGDKPVDRSVDKGVA